MYSHHFERIVTSLTIPAPMNGIPGKSVYLIMDKGVAQEKLLVQ